MKSFLVSFFLIIISLFSSSQNIRVNTITTRFTSRHFTIADGLPQIQITNLFNDSNGFVWVGTKFGIARWDGKRFKVFTQKEGALGRQVTAIGELSNGIVLVGWQSNAMNLIIGDKAESILFPDKWNVRSVTKFGVNGNEGFYVSLSIQIEDHVPFNSLIAYYNLRLKRFTKEYWFKDNWIGSINGAGHIVAGFVAPGENTPPTFRLYHCDTLLSDFRPSVPIVFLNSNRPFGNPYLSIDKSSLLQLEVVGNKLKEKFLPISIEKDLPPSSAYQFCDNNEGELIYCNNNGQLVLADKFGYSYLGNVPSCNVILRDKDNNIWVGTENGLYCFYGMGFQEMIFAPPASPFVDEVWSMAKATNGTYYYASFRKGFWQSKDNNKTWTKIPDLEKLNVSTRMQKGAYGSLGLSNGAVILTTTAGFYYLDDKGAKAFDLFGKGAEVYSVMEDSKHRYVYINKWTYLFRLDLNTLKLDTLLNSYKLNGNVILNVVEDEDGNPIITGGIAPHIFKDDKWVPYSKGPRASGLTSYYDDYGTLWVGSAQKLTCVKKDTTFEMKNFPARQEVISMVEWGKKWLIIGGGVDIVFFDLETFYKTGREEYQRFDAGSGFVTTEGGQNSFLIDKDSSVWWCCSDKILHFWPQKILAYVSNINKPIFYSINTYNPNAESKDLLSSDFDDERNLEKGFRRLEYHFGSAAVNNNDQLLYRYKLSDRDSIWSPVSNSGEAIFDKLSPGKYRLEIQSSIDGLKWSETIKAPVIIIPAYWYETSLFYILIVFGAFSIFIASAWAYSKWKQKGIERQKQLNELQLKAIRSKALPHFTGNSFANIDFYIEKGDTENASRYLAILSRLHNITLADSDKPSRSIEEEIDYVKLYLQMEKLRFEHKLEYIIEVDPSIDQEQQVPNMVLHTYAENALKHGLKHKEGNGLIVVKVANQSGGVLLSVTDNGIGREAAARMKSFGTQQGLSILGKQIELYNQQNKEKMVQEVVDMLDEEGRVIGTRFAIFIPSNFKY